MRKIPLKNYIVLSIILVLTIFITIFIMNLFKNYTKNSSDNAFKNKINFNELETYLLENSDFIIYLVDNSFDNSVFEKKFKKFIIDNDLNNQLVYIDVNDVDQKQFLLFVSKYGQKSLNMEINNYVIIINDQKIAAIISITPELKDLKNIKQEFKEKGVI